MSYGATVKATVGLSVNIAREGIEKLFKISDWLYYFLN